MTKFFSWIERLFINTKRCLYLSYIKIDCGLYYTYEQRIEFIAGISDQPFVAVEPKNHLLYRGFFSRAVSRRDWSSVDRVPCLNRDLHGLWSSRMNHSKQPNFDEFSCRYGVKRMLKLSRNLFKYNYHVS